MSSFKKEVFSLLNKIKNERIEKGKFIFQKETFNQVELGDNVIDVLKNIVETKKAQRVIFKDGSGDRVDSFCAGSLLNVYEFLTPDNKKIMESVIVESQEDFKKLLDFSLANKRKET